MDLQFNEKTNGENNSQFAYRVLRENIMYLNMEPGEIINESEISDTLKISRTPIREAIFRLREEMLIEVYSQSKSCVSLIDFLLAKEGQFIRGAIEPLIYKSLCGRLSNEISEKLGENLQLQKYISEGHTTTQRFLELDNEFHHLLYVAANKEMTWNMIQKACTHYDRIRFLNDKIGTNRFNSIYLEHKEILRFILLGNIEAVESNTVSHINLPKTGENTFYPFFAKMIEKYGKYFKNIPSNMKYMQ